MSEPQHRDPLSHDPLSRDPLSRGRAWHPSVPPETPDDEVDLDHWVEMASGDPSPVLTGPSDPEAMAALRDDLLRVLDSDDGSFVPPSAGGMSQDDWDALGARQRWVYQRTQLRRLDPRLISRTVSRLTSTRRLGAR